MNEKGVNIKITTQAELSALQATESALVKQYVAAKALGQEYKNLERDLEKVQQRISAVKALPPTPAPPKASFGQKLGDATKEAIQEIPVVGAFSRAFNGALPLVGAGLLVIKKGFDIAGEAIHEFAAKQAEMTKLDAALANSGQLTDAYRAKLEELAKERAGATGISHEKYFSTFATLTKFGADSSNIDQYTHAVENLAGFLNGDMDQAAFFFGKAMQGSTAMLTRYGIHVDSAKSSTEQLADIMRQLEARGGGQLVALGNTLQGTFNKVKNSWGEVLASMGSMAETSGLAEYLTKFSQGLQNLADRMGGGTPSKSKNRPSELIGDTQESQTLADDIGAQRNQIQMDMVARQDENQAASARIRERKAIQKDTGDLYDTPEAVKQLADDEATVAENKKILLQLSVALGKLNSKAKAAGLREVTPDEAQKNRDRLSSTYTGPFLNAEDQSSAEKAGQIAMEELAAKREILDVDLKIAVARKAGNLQEVATLEWGKKYQEAKKQAEAALMPYPEVYARDVANATAPSSDPNAEKREELALQLQIAEAAASGNKEQEQKLKWQQDYNKFLKENLAVQDPDAWNNAIRGANAATTKPNSDPFQHAAPITDRLSQIGGYNSPSQVRADRSMSVIEEATKRTAAATEKIAEKSDPKIPVTNTF